MSVRNTKAGFRKLIARSGEGVECIAYKASGPYHRDLEQALLDRLLHRCHIVNIRCNSQPIRRQMELSKTIHPTASRAVDAETARLVEAS